MHIQPRLRGDPGAVHRLKPDHILHFLRHLIRLRARQINLIDHRQDLQIVVQRQIDISQSLGFHALGRIDYQHGPVAGRQGAGYLIVEIDVAGCIDQVEYIFLPVVRLVNRTDRLGFDRNAPLPFQFHVVQHLILHLPLGQKAGHLDDAVGQCALAMVNMCNDTKISDFTLVHVSRLSFYKKYCMELYHTDPCRVKRQTGLEPVCHSLSLLFKA